MDENCGNGVGVVVVRAHNPRDRDFHEEFRRYFRTYDSAQERAPEVLADCRAMYDAVEGERVHQHEEVWEFDVLHVAFED